MAKAKAKAKKLTGQRSFLFSEPAPPEASEAEKPRPLSPKSPAGQAASPLPSPAAAAGPPKREPLPAGSAKSRPANPKSAGKAKRNEAGAPAPVYVFTFGGEVEELEGIDKSMVGDDLVFPWDTVLWCCEGDKEWKRPAKVAEKPKNQGDKSAKASKGTKSHNAPETRHVS